MELGKLGVWTFLDMRSPDETAAFAERIERQGYAALWTPEAMGRNPFAVIGFLAARTSRLVLATGIASIYARDPMAMRAARDTLAELSGGRFLLGLGVSHAPMVSGLRGHEYGKPVTTMRNYLEAIEKAVYVGNAPPEPPPMVLAALRPKMLALAASSATGAHPYNVTPEHTARAREIMGPDAWICTEQKILLETDAAKARALARKHLRIYMTLPNYRNNWNDLGFDDSEIDGGGSDRFVDAMVAWGDEDAIRKRIDEHLEAGASHVCVQPFRADGEMGPDEKVLDLLAPAGA